MSYANKAPQMSGQLELPWGGRGEAPVALRSEEERATASGVNCTARRSLMEAVVSPSNLRAAMKRVKRNKGSPGVDGMTVEELPDFLRENWKSIREQLLTGRYQPKAVRRKAISEEWRWGTRARHPNGARPLHPTSVIAGASASV